MRNIIDWVDSSFEHKALKMRRVRLRYNNLLTWDPLLHKNLRGKIHNHLQDVAVTSVICCEGDRWTMSLNIGKGRDLIGDKKIY